MPAKALGVDVGKSGVSEDVPCLARSLAGRWRTGRGHCRFAAVISAMGMEKVNLCAPARMARWTRQREQNRPTVQHGRPRGWPWEQSLLSYARQPAGQADALGTVAGPEGQSPLLGFGGPESRPIFWPPESRPP